MRQVPRRIVDAVASVPAAEHEKLFAACTHIEVAKGGVFIRAGEVPNKSFCCTTLGCRSIPCCGGTSLRTTDSLP